MTARLFAVVRTVIAGSPFVSLWTWFLPGWIIGRTALADQRPLGWIVIAFGDDYTEYCRHVRRWIPRVRPLD